MIDVDEDMFDSVRGEAESLAGVMLEVKRDFLKVGDSVTVEPLRFTVTSQSQRRIETIRVVIKR